MERWQQRVSLTHSVAIQTACAPSRNKSRRKHLSVNLWTTGNTALLANTISMEGIAKRTRAKRGGSNKIHRTPTPITTWDTYGSRQRGKHEAGYTPPSSGRQK